MNRGILTALRRLTVDRRGTSALEFSFIALPLIVLLVAIVEFGRAFWVRNLMQFAVEEAGRYAMVNTSATTTAVANVASAKLTGYGLTIKSLTVNATTSTASGINYMSVTAQYQFSFATHLLPISTLTLSSQSMVPLTL